MKKKIPILTWPKPGPGLQNRAPVQKLIWNLYFLLYHRFCHPKYTPKNQSEGVCRDKKNLQDLALWCRISLQGLGWSKWKTIIAISAVTLKYFLTCLFQFNRFFIRSRSGIVKQSINMVGDSTSECCKCRSIWNSFIFVY